MSQQSPLTTDDESNHPIPTSCDQPDPENTIETPLPVPVEPPPEAAAAAAAAAAMVPTAPPPFSSVISDTILPTFLEKGLEETNHAMIVDTDQVATPIWQDGVDATNLVAGGDDMGHTPPLEHDDPIMTVTEIQPLPQDHTSVRHCTVIAPATLPEGYTFAANVDGIDFVVTVPKGGVPEGVAFSVPYPTTHQGEEATVTEMLQEEGPYQQQSLEVEMSPVQREEPTTSLSESQPVWSTHLCDCGGIPCQKDQKGCSKNGAMCLCLQGLFCTPLLLAQLLQRTHWDPSCCGRPRNANETTTGRIFWAISFVWVVYIVLVSYFRQYVVASYVLVMTIMVSQLRQVMRRHFHIPQGSDCCQCQQEEKGCCCHECACCYESAGCCGRQDGLEDVCCGLFCAGCATIQMARQLHDPLQKEDYHYVCCSPTGVDPRRVSDTVVLSWV